MCQHPKHITVLFGLSVGTVCDKRDFITILFAFGFRSCICLFVSRLSGHQVRVHALNAQSDEREVRHANLRIWMAIEIRLGKRNVRRHLVDGQRTMWYELILGCSPHNRGRIVCREYLSFFPAVDRYFLRFVCHSLDHLRAKLNYIHSLPDHFPGRRSLENLISGKWQRANPEFVADRFTSSDKHMTQLFANFRFHIFCEAD